MPSQRDVLVLGAGIAGLTAAYRLRGLDVEVVDAAAHLGGRTRSVEYPGGGWANFGAQYLSADKVAVIELAEELGVELVPSDLTDALLRGRERLGEQQTRDLEAAVARLEAEQAHPRDPGSPDLDDRTFAQWLEGEAEHVVHYFDHWSATTPSLRKPPTKVEVFQCPKGALPGSRSPLGPQPRSGAMLVLIQVSSRLASLSARIPA